MTPRDPSKPAGSDSALLAYGVYGAAGIQLAAGVVGGALAGDWLDAKLSTAPWLTIALIFLGFVGGIVNLMRIVGWFNRRKG